MGLLNDLRSRFSIDWNNTDGTVGGGGIDSVDQSKKRRVPRGKTRGLDDEIGDSKRKALTLSSRNLTRNFELAGWAIRKHLDFVASFNFTMRTGIDSFDRDVENFVRWWSRPTNFDSSGRHGLRKSIRIAEALRVLDGDVFTLKIGDGRVQWVEADRVKTPDARRDAPFDEARTFNGIETSSTGRPLRYAVHSRLRGGGLDFEKWVRARNVFAHGFFERFDQVRGVSPLSAALGRFQDVYEGFDYALQRAKVAQLFGLVLTRDTAENHLGPVEGEDVDGDGTNDRFDVKLGSRPIVLDMNPDDDAKFLENKTPAPEFQQFSDMMIGIALKSLDLPFSFAREDFTNFFGSKAALTLYLQSARDKRDDVKELLRKLTIWRLRLAIEDGAIVLPRSVQTIDDIRFEWVPTGIPWFDPRDVRGDIDAIKAGLKTRTQVRRERFGDDWSQDVAPELAAEESLIDELGLSVTMDTTGGGAASVNTPEDEEDVETTEGGRTR